MGSLVQKEGLLLILAGALAIAPAPSFGATGFHKASENPGERTQKRSRLAKGASALAALLLGAGAVHGASDLSVESERSLPREEQSAKPNYYEKVHGDFRDGDVLYLLGDSNLEWNPAVQTLRIWLRMRFPKWNIQVINAGVAGSNASETSWTRVDSELFDSNRPIPTRVFVIFGINDIGWGKHHGEERKTLEHYYIEGLERITTEVKAKSPSTQVLIMSYPPVTAPGPEALRKDPGLEVLGQLDSDSDGQLNVLSRRGMVAAEKLGAEKMDLNRFMRESMGSLRAHGRPKYNWVGDGVHLNAQGADHEVAAFLRGMHAPRIVSSVTVDAKNLRESPEVEEAEGAVVSNLTMDPSRKRFSFERLDDGLPYVRGFFEDGHAPTDDFSHSPLREYTQYQFKVAHLPPGQYSISVGGDATHEGREISPAGGISASRFAAGMDLAFMGHNPYAPLTPWGVKSRSQSLLAGDRQDKARLNTVNYLAEDPGKADDLIVIEKLRVSEAETARKLAQPYPIHFTVERIGK